MDVEGAYVPPSVSILWPCELQHLRVAFLFLMHLFLLKILILMQLCSHIKNKFMNVVHKGVLQCNRYEVHNM